MVELTMCYGQYSAQEVIQKLKDHDVREVIVLPLYPQYCGATTAASFDAVAKAYMKFRWLPHMHFIHGYHDEPLLIKALAESIQAHCQAHGKPDLLLFSYHGTPKKYHTKGDPYACYCYQTTRLVQECLGWSSDSVLTTFQSRFGKEEWLQPYTDEVLVEKAKQGVAHIAVICPGFQQTAWKL